MSAKLCRHGGEDVAYWSFYCPACKAIAELKDEYDEQLNEAYKKGYIDRGIELLNRLEGVIGD